MKKTDNEATTSESLTTTQNYAKWLWLCAGLFAIRVIAQAISRVFPSEFLPNFESWHGGVLPYPTLLTTQLLILFWLVWTARKISLNCLHPRQRIGMIAMMFASLYFIIMLLRLILGLTILSDHRWFASYLPAFFHLVLAGYLFLYGHFHFRHGLKKAHK
jgi:hypothetical protein